MALNIFMPEFRGTSIERVNPLVKMLYVIVFSIIISKSSGYETIAWAVLIALFSIPWKVGMFRKIAGTPAITVITALILLTDILNGYGFLYTISDALRFISYFEIAIIFTSVTDTMDLAASLASPLSHIIGKFAYEFSSSVMLSVSLLPEIFVSSREMLDARKSRGGAFLSHPVRNISEYSLSLITRLINSALMFQDALDSRLYDSGAKRVAPGYGFSDIMLLILLFVITGVRIWIRIF